MNLYDGAVKVNHNLLRQTTSFVGREREILEILDRLNNPMCQLLTFVGPGGIGKTRLALEVARQIRNSYRDGVYFVPLQPLRSASHIPSAIIHVLGVSIRDGDDPFQKLLHFLSDRHLLLLLDNFEHLVDGAELVTCILENAPDVRLLVTSREPLKLHEEWQWVVGGLHFPTEAPDEADEAYSAMRLFAERATQINPEFTLDQYRADVIRICQLVEGIPLAIEMAANWTNSLTCDAIADAIQNNIDFLTSREQNIPERHRSMRAVYNHSWRLLFEEERRVFERLSVFHGGFTREAAEQVEGATLETLASLVDKSFLKQDSSGRYDIHELLRQYGAEQLAKSDGTKAAADRHLAFYADFMQRCEPDLKGKAELAALNRIEADFENIRAAWSYAVAQREYDMVDRIIDSLFWFGLWRGRIVEIRLLFFETAVEVFTPKAGTSPHPVWGRLLVRKSRNRDVNVIDRAMEIAGNCGNEAEVAYCLLERAIYDTNHRNPHALTEIQRALDIYRQLGDNFGVAGTLSDLTYLLITSGDLDAFWLSLDEALQQVRKTGCSWYLYNLLFRRGWTACFDGHYDNCERDLEEALGIANRMEFRVVEADCIGSLGFLAFLRGNFQQAKRRVSDDIETVTQVKAAGEQGFAKIVLAYITCIEGNYHEARQLAEEALVLVKPHPIRERLSARVLAMAEYGLGNFDKAREHARWVLAEEVQTGTRLWNIPVFALLLAHDGDTEGAAELLGLMFTHPASPIGWFENWTLIKDLRAQLADQLGADAYAAAWQRGATLDLDTIVETLLVTTDEQARQPLDEPLTDRELEVLRLVADGLSNHEIAESLTLVEGTVRSHVYNLCQKLGVRNRTGAVARARALHMLH